MHILSTFDLCIRFICSKLSVHTPVDILRALVTDFNTKTFSFKQNSLHVHSFVNCNTYVFVLLQIFLEVLPEMQPELFEECRQS